MTETEWPDDWPLRAIERIERAEEEALNFSRMMVAEEKRAQKAEREVAELRAAGDAVVPFLVAEKPIDYVADGEAWNKRAAFLSLHQAAYHKFREEWVARKKMNQPHAQGGD